MKMRYDVEDVETPESVLRLFEEWLGDEEGVGV